MGDSTVVNKVLIGTLKRDPHLRGLGIFATPGTAYLYFQSSQDTNETFHIATSDDGYSFQADPRTFSIETAPHTYENLSHIYNFTISEYGQHFLLLYTRVDEKGKTKLCKAWSKDLYHWTLEGPMIQAETSGVIVTDYTYKRQSILLGGEKTIDIYTSSDLITWANQGTVLEPREGYFDTREIHIANTFLTPKGILVLYHTDNGSEYRVGVALLDPKNPQHVLWRCAEPIWVVPEDWMQQEAYPLGTILVENTILSYWHVPQLGIFSVAYAVYHVGTGMQDSSVSLHLARPETNPLIAPQPTAWESHGTFNPAAIYDSGKVHILYRAQGDDWVSVVGYASSSDGIHIDERLEEPIYRPSEPFEYTPYIKPEEVVTEYMSAGGCGGVEDARITRIGDRFYMTYVAFNGYDQPRIALTSIAAADFLNKRWLWEKPVLISPPGVIDKNAVIFPEKVNGKYVVMHRIFPDILIDFVDSLEFDGKDNFLKGEFKISPRPDMWDSRKIAAGAPPIKTKDGWLLIYHGTCDQEGAGRYLVGAMLLDLDDPTKVIARSKAPILEPEAWYEWEGFKGGVVYPCGAVVIGDTLYVYYGGADWHVCVATANLEQFLSELKYSEVAKLSHPIIQSLFDTKKAARSTQNPILSPDPEHPWEAQGTMNGSILIEPHAVRFVYRADSAEQDYEGHKLNLRTVGIADTKDGIHFTRRRQLVVPSEDWDRYGCEDPRICKVDNEYFVFYTALGGFPYGPDNIKVGLALFTDLSGKPEKHLITPFNAKAMVLLSEKINGKYVALLTVDTDVPPKPDQICIATFDKKEDMWDEMYWNQWYRELDKHILPVRRMTSDQVEVGAVPIKTEKGWLFIYSHMQHYDRPDKRILGVEAVLLDLNNPYNIIAWTESPILTPEATYEINGIAPRVVFPTGAAIVSGLLYVYYGAADQYCALATFDIDDVYAHMRTNAVVPIRVKKYDTPLLSPIPEHQWEEKAVFNPAVICISPEDCTAARDKELHILYRAMSTDNTSVLGHADTKDGLTISKRGEIPIYVPRAEFERKKNPGNNSGCEDPRATIVDKTLYLTYTAYNGVEPPRVALTSISIDNFHAREYNWADPILLSPPGIDDKDAALFPEKFGERFCVIHRLQNSIALSFVEDFTQIDDTHWMHTHAYIPPRGDSWDSEKIGVSAPPIKTPDGWLLLYHGVSKLSHIYRVGAMLLDLKDPSIVLSRTPWPIMEPDQQYEISGIVNNVVFPCGAVVKDDTLYIYYGAADTRVGVATISFSKLLTYLRDIKSPSYLG